MAEQSQSFKKKKHFLSLIKDVPRDKILFVPIDVAKDFHVTLFHDIDCQPLSEFFSFSASRRGFETFAAQLEQVVSQRAPQLLIFGMEPTGIYYEGLLHQLRQDYGARAAPRCELAIVDPAAVKSNRAQLALPFHKTDQVDAAANGELLARGLYTPAYLPTPSTLRLRELARSINDYAVDQLRLWNRLLVSVERVFPNLLLNYGAEKPLVKEPSRTDLFLDLLHVCPDPARILALSDKELIALFHQQQRRLGPKRAALLRQAAQRALLQPAALRAVHQQTLAQQLQHYDWLQAQSATLTQQLHELLPLTPARHLIAMPGNSATLVGEFVAALEDWERFPSVQQVWATAGFEPTYQQSGQQRGAIHISRHGSGRLRQAIYKMTNCVVWHEPTFGIPCFERLRQGRAYVPTILHIGRKLTNTALAVLKADRPFVAPYADYAAAQARHRELKELYLTEKQPQRSSRAQRARR